MNTHNAPHASTPQPNTPILASRIQRLKPSLVREILHVAARRDMISFAGGLPAADLMPDFPSEIMEEGALFQYGATEGENSWREAVADWIAETGFAVRPSQILPLAGSQQGLDLAAKLLIEPGASLLTEAPTYLAALQVFELFGAHIEAVPLKDTGPDLAVLEERLQTTRPRAIYLVPTFQNPSGICYDLATRHSIAQLLDQYGTLLIEDDPYRAVALDLHHAATPICAMLKRAPWVYLGSFSKILWPGMRIGFLAAREDLLPHLLALKQACDLHTQRPGQIAVSHWLRSTRRATDLDRLRAGYRVRRDAMEATLRRHFSDLATWTTPQGGLFFWLKLSSHRATRALLESALAQGVAFMPGETFFPRRDDQYHLRLNYSHATPAQMETGLARLAALIRQSRQE